MHSSQQILAGRCLTNARQLDASICIRLLQLTEQSCRSSAEAAASRSSKYACSSVALGENFARAEAHGGHVLHARAFARKFSFVVKHVAKAALGTILGDCRAKSTFFFAWLGRLGYCDYASAMDLTWLNLHRDRHFARLGRTSRIASHERRRCRVKIAAALQEQELKHVETQDC